MKALFLTLPLLSLTALEWTPPVNVGSGASPVLPATGIPQVAINNSGSLAVAVWEAIDGSMQGATLVDTVWSAPQTITTGPATNPQVAITSATSGRAVAVWELSGSSIQAAIYESGSWSAPHTFTTSGIATNPQVVINSPETGSDTALAIWQTNTGTPTEKTIIQMASNPGFPVTPSGWGSVITANIPSMVRSANTPQIAIDPDGNALAVWEGLIMINNATMGSYIEANTYLGGGWGTPIPLTTVATGLFANSPQIAADPSLDAVAIWAVPSDNASSPTNSYIQASAYISGSWGAPISITPMTVSDVASVPQIGVDADGNATAVWQYASGGSTNIQAATLPFSSTSPTTYPNLNTSGTTTVPQVKVDPSGHAIAIWQNNIGPSTIIESASLSPGDSAWSAPVDITSTGTASTPELSINSYGNAVAVWQLDNGGSTLIQASVTKPAPPADFTVQKMTNKFLTQSNSINLLSWDPSPDFVIEYQLFENGILIATVPPSDPLKIPVPAKSKTANTYTIVAVNEMGTQSDPISITVP